MIWEVPGHRAVLHTEQGTWILASRHSPVFPWGLRFVSVEGGRSWIINYRGELIGLPWVNGRQPPASEVPEEVKRELRELGVIR